MVNQGEEYLGSLENYIDRKNADSIRIVDLFDFLFRDPEYYNRAKVAKIAVEKLDKEYYAARKEIEDALVNGGYENGVLAPGPCIVNSTKERRQAVENLTEIVKKIYQKHLLYIDDYGTGKRDKPPVFIMIKDEIETSMNNQPGHKPDDCDVNYIQ